jgi:DNA modification methylase
MAICAYYNDDKVTLLLGDALTTIRDLPERSVDCIVTSPPYWRKRDYNNRDGQIGHESTPETYASVISGILAAGARALTHTGSVWLNIGDSYHRRTLAGIPAMVECGARAGGWLVRNRVVWSKTGGTPDPVRDRLTGRHEYVIHLTGKGRYYYDLPGYADKYGNGSNPGDVWHIEPERGRSGHPAPFPADLARRAMVLGCPPRVCVTCGDPSTRITTRSTTLDPTRPQARRAMELAATGGLTDAHISAIQATGISDAGKALLIQTGTGRNSSSVRALAQEAKAVLGGYFREYTFAPRITTGWTDCGHDNWRAGIVMDPFSGTGTTGVVARELGHDYIGVDVDASYHDMAISRFEEPKS